MKIGVGVELDWLENELVKIDALPLSWWKKFRLRVLAGKASSSPLFMSRYYLKFQEYRGEINVD